MGCDIHLICQIKNGDEWETVKTGGNCLEDRCYARFGLLADVRNGYGFAGCDTGDAVTPISKPRGLPKDLQEFYGDWVAIDDHWLGDHSHSYLFYSELLAIDLNRMQEVRGYVTAEQYRKQHFYAPYEQRTYPENGWCGGISGSGLIILDSEDEVEEELLYRDDVYIKTRWPESIESYMSNFLEELSHVFEGKDPEQCRIVFGFDS